MHMNNVVLFYFVVISISFTTTNLTVKEDVGVVSIPISISGLTNVELVLNITNRDGTAIGK